MVSLCKSRNCTAALSSSFKSTNSAVSLPSKCKFFATGISLPLFELSTQNARTQIPNCGLYVIAKHKLDRTDTSSLRALL